MLAWQGLSWGLAEVCAGGFAAAMAFEQLGFSVLSRVTSA
jgi:hypothetical protein